MPVLPSQRRAGAPASTDLATAPRELAWRLFEAQRLVTRDLSLPAMLGRIVTAACNLAGVDDAVVAVIAPNGSWERVVHHGDGARLLHRVARPLLTPAFDLAPEAGGAGRVTALPLRVARDQFGVLALAAADGVRLDPDLRAALTTFAAVVGTALENALRHDEARRSRDWLNASGEIARALLADADADTLLGVVSRALYVAEADLCSLVLPTCDGRLRVAVTVGVDAGDWRDFVFEPDSSPAGRAIAAGTSVIMADLSSMARTGWSNEHGYGPAMIAPLIDAKGIRGAVVLVRLVGRPQFTDQELDLATTFADQVAVALELNDMRSDAESMRVLEDRLRIAQQLHDNVMQRLFAIGIGLQAVADSELPDAVAKRLRAAIDDFDVTIAEIRETVFGLRSGAVSAGARTAVRLPRRALVPCDSPAATPGRIAAGTPADGPGAAPQRG